LAALILQLPGGRWTKADSRAISDRLIELLPRRSSSKMPLAEKANGLREMKISATTKMLICAALAATVLIVAANREPPSRAENIDVPAFNTTSPPQTPRPSSR
jgi:hypothetical protein